MKKRIPLIAEVAVCLGTAGVLTFFLFRNPVSVSQGIKSGLTVVGGVLIPSLFPFMVLSCFIQNSRAGEAISAVFSVITRGLFRLPSEASTAILMSFIAGYPVGARLTQLLLREGKISKKEAARMCLFCVNAGPAFIISTVGVNMLSNVRAGVLLFCSTTLSSVIIGFVSGRILSQKVSKPDAVKEKSHGLNMFEAFTLSCSQATASMLSVSAYVLIFTAAVYIIKGFELSDNLFAFIVGSLEVTNGALTVSCGYPLPVLAAVIGFGGLSVHFQVMGAVIESGLKKRHFFAVRFISAALSAAVCQGLLYLFPLGLEVFAAGEKITALPYRISLPCCIAFLLMSVSLIFDIAPGKKV